MAKKRTDGKQPKGNLAKPIKPSKPGKPGNPPPKPPDGQTVDAIFNEVKARLLGVVKDVHAVCAIPTQGGEYKIRITLDENTNVQDEDTVRQALGQIQGLDTMNDIEFNKSKALNFFAPYPVCAQYSDIKSSCGPFLKNGNKLAVLAAAHAMPDEGERLKMAKLHSLTPVMAEVLYNKYGDRSTPSTDIAIAEVIKPLPDWPMFLTKIKNPVPGEAVSHFGSASVEECPGTIVSTIVSANIGGKIFHDIILLSIHSQHGDSGAPVVKRDNSVIGLIIGGDSSSNQIYCSNLSVHQGLVRNAFPYEGIYLNGTKERSSWIDERRNRKREIELRLISGCIIKRPSRENYGEILADLPDGGGQVSVLIHPDHSFDSRDPVFTNKRVWFFAVPLEYVVHAEQMVGASNLSPLLAINVSNKRRSLEPLSGLHKLQPCGTGTTPPPPAPPGGDLAMKKLYLSDTYSEKTKRVLMPKKKTAVSAISTSSGKGSKGGSVSGKDKPEKGKAGSKDYFIINDYGELMIVPSIRPILPWAKVVGHDVKKDKAFKQARANNPNRVLRENAKVCLRFDTCRKDNDWEWKPKKRTE
ncbi:MAG TPA: hypothetical protein VI603_02500 [Saprospiraceae bacterium]|nr:hypothetical protein [Saprospiraceae bacterium]